MNPATENSSDEFRTTEGTFRHLRIRLGLSCDGLASELGCSSRSVFRWEQYPVGSRPRLALTLLGLAVRIGDDCITEELLEMLGGPTHWSGDQQQNLSDDKLKAINGWLRDRSSMEVLALGGEKFSKRRIIVGSRTYVFAAKIGQPERVVLGLWLRSEDSVTKRQIA